MLVIVGWWPPEVPFDVDDVATVGAVLKARNGTKGRR